MLCVAILGSDVGQNRSENVGDHKLVSDLAKNRSENSPSRPKTGRRFSVSDLSPTVNAKAAFKLPESTWSGVVVDESRWVLDVAVTRRS